MPRDEATLQRVPATELPAGLIRLAGLFNGPVMGLLALIALATALGPMVFDVTPNVERALNVVEWVLVGVFAAEFVTSGTLEYRSDNFREWAVSPWRVVDLATMLGPLAAVLPQVSDAFTGSLALRALRIGRAVAFGTRAGASAVMNRSLPLSVRQPEPVFRVVRQDEPHAVEFARGSLVAWLREPEAFSWLHATGVNRGDFRELARGAGLAERDSGRLLNHEGQGKVWESSRCAAVVTQIPLAAEPDVPDIVWVSLLLITTGRGLFTAVDARLDLHTTVDAGAARLASPSFCAQLTSAILSLARNQHKALIERFEKEVLRWEAEDGNEFLRGTFRLRREISAAALHVRRFKDLMRSLADGQAQLKGVELRDEIYIDELAQDMEALYAKIMQTKDDLQSMIELQINLQSFEVNRFLKLLAVISFVGLLPSILGGLLGTNIEGQPFPVTLGQIAFVAVMGTGIAVYVFAVKGWLK